MSDTTVTENERSEESEEVVTVQGGTEPACRTSTRLHNLKEAFPFALGLLGNVYPSMITEITDLNVSYQEMRAISTLVIISMLH